MAHPQSSPQKVTVQMAEAEPAQQAIDTLGAYYVTLNDRSTKLAAHLRLRGSLEREAVEFITGKYEVQDGKMVSRTWAENHLDLSPDFAQWREERDQLEADVRDLQGRIQVQLRIADLELLRLRAVLP